jgi:serine/threonine-protein kinase
MLRMLDFGIAKIMEGDAVGDTRRGRSSGVTGFSPDYAAPEQITYSRTGPWTDVHALGLLMTELLTDEPPFSAGADEQLFEQIMSADRPTPGRRGVNAGNLERVVARALALSPSRRWKDAGQLLHALDARTPAGALRLRHASARHLSRRLLTAAAAVLASRPWRKARETWRVKRPRDLGMPVSGGLAILSIFALLVWALGSSGARPRGGAARAATATTVRPWIVPIPACASGVAAGTSAAVTGTEAPTAARRPSRQPRPPTPPPVQHDENADGNSCSVSVNSVPWSEVWIDGKNTGRHTPFVDVPIDCGKHRIDFIRADLHIAESELISVQPGQPFRQRYTLAGGTE